jgi:hypothetical protein
VLMRSNTNANAGHVNRFTVRAADAEPPQNPTSLGVRGAWRWPAFALVLLLMSTLLALPFVALLAKALPTLHLGALIAPLRQRWHRWARVRGRAGSLW